MGSSLSQLLCWLLCRSCREQQAADAEPSETKPVLQSPGHTQSFPDTQPPTPALKIPKQGPKELSQDHQPSPAALEESGEPCSAAEGWEAAWNPMDFFVAPTDEEAEGEAEDLTQQEPVGKTEEEMEAGTDDAGTAVGAEPLAQEGQPGTERAPGAGMALQEGNSLSLIELGSEDEPEPPAGTRGVLVGLDLSLCDLSLCAAQLPGQPESPLSATDGAKAAQTSLLPSISFLAEAMSHLSLQSPTEVTAGAGAELCSTSAVFWKPLCPQWGSLEPPQQLLQLLQQGSLAPAQGLGSAGLAGLSETLQQLQDGALGELGQEGSRGCTPGPEAERGVMQPAVELPEPATSLPVQQEAELPSLPEVLGNSGEIEAENVEA